MIEPSSKKWKPPDLSVQQYRQELAKRFTRFEGPKGLLTQYVNIRLFLEEPLAVIEQLIKIEKLLIKKGSERNVLDEEKKPAVLKAPVKGEFYPQQSKVLSHVILEQLGRRGFQEGFAKADWKIKPAGFRALLRQGLLIKDSGLRNNTHGDFSHSIQWLAIALQQEDSGFLDRPVIDIYKSLGEDFNVFTNSSKRLVDVRETSVWDFIVDRVSSIEIQRRDYNSDAWQEDLNGFSSPMILNLFLCKTNDPELSFFRSLVLSRDTKRTKESKGVLLIESEASNKIHKDKYPNAQYLSSGIRRLKLPESFKEIKDSKPSFFPLRNIKDDTIMHEILPKIQKIDAGQTAIDTYSELHEQVKQHPLNISAMQLDKYICFKLGLLYAATNLFDKALSYMEEALSIHKKLTKLNQTESTHEILNIKKNRIILNLDMIENQLRESDSNESTCIIS